MDVKEILGTVGMLLPVLVQWLRAQKSFPEWAAVALIGAVGVGCYWLFNEGNPLTREFWQGAIQWVLMALGVNQATSSAANAGVAAIPQTNSKP